MSQIHRVHSNHMGTWNKIFMSLSPDRQTEYEHRVDSVFEQIEKLHDEKTNSPTTPDMVKKNVERL